MGLKANCKSTDERRNCNIFKKHQHTWTRKVVDLNILKDEVQHTNFQAKKPHLELGQLCLIDGVSLGNDGDDVDLLVQLLHTHKVDGFQAMTIWSDEIETDMDSCVVITRQVSLDLKFLLKVSLKLTINIVDN